MRWQPKSQLPKGLAFLPSGHLAVVETGTGNVMAMDLGSGVKTTIARGISPAYTLLSGGSRLGHQRHRGRPIGQRLRDLTA